MKKSCPQRILGIITFGHLESWAKDREGRQLEWISVSFAFLRFVSAIDMRCGVAYEILDNECYDRYDR
jgi:hypothetical protein